MISKSKRLKTHTTIDVDNKRETLPEYKALISIDFESIYIYMIAFYLV